MAETFIRHKDAILSYIDYSGLGNRFVHPTDIDAALEFDNKYLILMEAKYRASAIPAGQRLFLERVADAWCESSSDRKAVVLKLSYDNVDDNCVMLRETKVSSVYSGGKWHQRDVYLTEALDRLCESWGISKFKQYERASDTGKED